MSYSFSVRAASKAAAIVAVSGKMAEIVQQQPVHAADQAQAIGTAETFIGLLVADETQDVAVSMNGSIWQSEKGIQQASVAVSASIVTKEKAA